MALKCWDWRGKTKCKNNLCECLPGHYTKDKKECIPCPSAPNLISNSVTDPKTTTSQTSLLGNKDIL